MGTALAPVYDRQERKSESPRSGRNGCTCRKRSVAAWCANVPVWSTPAAANESRIVGLSCRLEALGERQVIFDEGIRRSP